MAEGFTDAIRRLKSTLNFRSLFAVVHQHVEMSYMRLMVVAQGPRY